MHKTHDRHSYRQTVDHVLAFSKSGRQLHNVQPKDAGQAESSTQEVAEESHTGLDDREIHKTMCGRTFIQA